MPAELFVFCKNPEAVGGRLAAAYGAKHAGGMRGTYARLGFATAASAKVTKPLIEAKGYTVQTQSEFRTAALTSIWNAMVKIKDLEATRKFFTDVHPRFKQPV